MNNTSGECKEKSIPIVIDEPGLQIHPLLIDALNTLLGCELSWRDVEVLYLRAQLKKHNQNRTYTAKSVGLSVRTIRNKLRKHKGQL